jgi:hypothetical protein
MRFDAGTLAGFLAVVSFSVSALVMQSKTFNQFSLARKRHRVVR